MSTITLTGTVERVTYYNEENGYSVIKIMPDSTLKEKDVRARDGTVAVVGSMPEVGVGEKLELTGFWVEDRKYGKQFRVETVSLSQPDSLDGIRAYLASGIVKGIGEATAAKIVDHFGVNTLNILNNDPERLKEVNSLKKGLAEKLAKVWADNVYTRQLMIFLQNYGITAKMAMRIIGHYGGDTINEVKQNPYILADDVRGIGFMRADVIARRMGIESDSRERIRAGISYALGELSRDGHTYAPRSLLIDKTCELLKLDTFEEIRSRVGALIDALLVSRELIAEDMPTDEGTIQAIYLPMYYRGESISALRLREMAESTSNIIQDMEDVDWISYLADLAKHNDVELSDIQQSAVKAALTNKVSVLTGGPGTGKTTTLRMVISALVQEKYSFALASPTGRAAKRLNEATGYDAFTIHRLLNYRPSEGFMVNEDDPLTEDFIIVDEASMIDQMLFYHLVQAIPEETHLLLVGDIDQLPSVGAGNVLNDIIESGVAHVTRLETIFRQSEESHIVSNAHNINAGRMPNLDNNSRDFFFFNTAEQDDPAEWARRLVIDIVESRLTEKFDGKYDPIRDVQVIAPMYRGKAGVDSLNESLQETLNGGMHIAGKKIGNRSYRVGDKIMQTRNNYEKEIFNGDIGFINSIDYTDQVIECTFDGRYVMYDFQEAEEMMLAYCISTHRSQGSEYPVVVMPILTQHYMMLQRNLLYTAITRAREVVVLVGDRKAVNMAVRNNKVSERYTGLKPRLMGLTQEPSEDMPYLFDWDEMY